MQYKDLDTALGAVLEKAYNIAEARSLYSPLRKIPTPEDPGYQSFEHSMGEVYRQRSYPRQFEVWFDEVVEVFNRFGLQVAKFKLKADSYDRATDSNEPAQVFLRRVKELEKIQDDIAYRNSYLSKTFKPPMVMRNKVLTQGAYRYAPTEKDYKNVISLLWEGRRIISPTGDELEPGKPMSRNTLEHKAGIDHDRLRAISKGIKIASKEKGMSINVRYPREVYLEIVQSYR